MCVNEKNNLTCDENKSFEHRISQSVACESEDCIFLILETCF